MTVQRAPDGLFVNRQIVGRRVESQVSHGRHRPVGSRKDQGKREGDKDGMPRGYAGASRQQTVGARERRQYPNGCQEEEPTACQAEIQAEPLFLPGQEVLYWPRLRPSSQPQGQDAEGGQKSPDQMDIRTSMLLLCNFVCGHEGSTPPKCGFQNAQVVEPVPFLLDQHLFDVRLAGHLVLPTLSRPVHSVLATLGRPPPRPRPLCIRRPRPGWGRIRCLRLRRRPVCPAP